MAKSACKKNNRQSDLILVFSCGLRENRQKEKCVRPMFHLSVYRVVLQACRGVETGRGLVGFYDRAVDTIQVSEAVVFDFDFSARACALWVDSDLGRQCSSQLRFGCSNVWIQSLRGFRGRRFPFVEILNSLLGLTDRPSVLHYLLREAALSHGILYAEQRPRMSE